MLVQKSRWKKPLFFLLMIMLSFFLSSCAAEEKAWQIAVDNHSAEGYQEYLDKYPNGQYAIEAEDELEWKSAEQRDTSRAYRSYLEAHPEGRYADKANWQITLSENDYQAFKEYLDKYPESEYAEEANKKCLLLLLFSSYENRDHEEINSYYNLLALHAPTEISDAVSILSDRWHEVTAVSWQDGHLALEQPVEVFRAAESVWKFSEQNFGFRAGVYLAKPRVKLTITQKYDRVENANLPIYDTAEILLTTAGCSIVEESETNYDATMQIDVKGSPRGANYDDGRWHWSGAYGSGVITFSAADETLQWNFSNSISPPYRITSNYLSPDSAPFYGAVFENYRPTLFEALGEIIGIPFYIAALQEPYIYTMQLDPSAKLNILGWEPDRGETGALYWIIHDDWDEVITIGKPAMMPLIQHIGRFSGPSFKIGETKSKPTEAMIAIADSHAVEPLIALLNKENASPRLLVTVIDILGELGDERALRPIETLRFDRDQDTFVRDAAIEVLKKLRQENE